MATKQIEDPNTGELISLLPLTSAPPYVDNIIYFDGTSTDPYSHYKRHIDNYVDIRWFGAKGNDPVADSNAFEKAINFCKTSEYTILLIPEGYTFDLDGETFDIGEITLKFTGGIIKNATLNGNSSSEYAPTSWIDAGCYKIFENVTLTNGWTSTSGTVWADWYGSIANNYSSADLKDSIDSLNEVFKVVTLNEGKYYSNKCNIEVNSLIG